MNTLVKKTLLLALAAAGPVAVAEPPKAEPARPAPIRSVFLMPATPYEGRDPFFPESARPYEAAVTASRTVEVNAFSVKGISVSRGHAMAIINNHTFAVGDEGDVMTANGRVHLRCTEIRAGVVVIEVNGAKRELSMGAK